MLCIGCQPHCNKAVKPDGLGRLGFDGTNYYFMLPDRMAKIWSPQKNSECDKLVKEFEKLRDLFPNEKQHRLGLFRFLKINQLRE